MLAANRQSMAALGKPFRLLLVSEVLTVLSMLVGHIAVMWWVAEQGGAKDLAIYGVMMSVTIFVAMPLLSPLSDRHPKRILLGCGLTVLTVETLLLSLLAQFWPYQLWVLIPLEMVAVVAIAVMQPAVMTITAELVRSEQLADALSLQKSAQSLGRMLGPALSGLVLAWSGVQAALWLHVAMFAVATWAAFRIPTGSYQAPTRQRHWGRELFAGLRAKWVIPVERYWTGLAFLTMLFFGPAIGILIPLRVQSLSLSPAWLGACEAALSAGMLLGALVVARWATQRFGRYRAAVGALMGEGLALGMVGVLDVRIALPLCFFATGLCLSVVQLVGQTHRLLAVPEDFRGRFSSSNLMVMHLAGTLGPAMAGLLLLQHGVAEIYLVFGAGLLLLAACYPLLPGYRAFLSLDHDTARNWYGRQYPQAFEAGK